MTLNLTLPTAS